MATKQQFGDASSAFFRVEVDGVQIGDFQEVSGLEATMTTEDYEEGGVNGFVRKLPGRMTWPNLTLKRGVINHDSLFKWLDDYQGSSISSKKASQRKAKAERKTAVVMLLGPDGKVLRKWNFVDVIPVRWSGPTFAASGAEALVEELEMTHHGFASDG